MQKENLSIILLMLYVTVKIACDILFFNHLEIHFFSLILKPTQSAFLYPVIFILLNWILLIHGKNKAFFIVIASMLMDGIFSLLVYSAHFVPTPDLNLRESLLTNGVHYISQDIWALFYHGFLGSISAYILEILLFLFIFKRFKKYWISTVLSVTITMFAHHLICDYPVFARQSNHPLYLTLSNYLLSVSLLISYILALVILEKLLRNNKKFNITFNSFIGNRAKS